MTATIWLRAETKHQEARIALTPTTAKKLIANGFSVVVENSTQSAIQTQLFADVGCTIATAGSWKSAPKDTWVIGLKELPQSDIPLCHRHIYFAHAYKNQQGWQDILNRFVKGNGALFDIEFLVEPSGRRVAAFGYWAGYTGCAVAIKNWIGQQLNYQPAMPSLTPYQDKDALINALRNTFSSAEKTARRKPKIIVIGANGRVGTGASDFAAELGIDVTSWDMAETAKGGPFDEILEHDIFINCVLVNSPIPPFIIQESLQLPSRNLSVISDVSCDPYGPHNPIPIYSECTTFDNPASRIVTGSNPLDLIAIEHLPSLLPIESSEDFSSQLLPYLLQLNSDGDGVWQRALDLFTEKTQSL